ncbi:MAG: hypothetical protein L0H75_04245 [Nitrosospira sp.]|nr:hypothetical protein [Nitrosospira sp.]
MDDVKNVIQWQNDLRSTLHVSIGSSPSIEIKEELLEVIRLQAPEKLAWQLFDHCAAVTRIYALFEQAICELVKEYLVFLSCITPEYQNLQECTRIQYRIGVANILSKWKSSKSLYSNITEDAIAAGLADGLRKKPYVLLAEAFLVDTDNYRTDTINRLFNRFGFSNAFAWVSHSVSIKEFCNRNLGTETAESYLNNFVQVRNEAAHGSTTSISSAGEILNYAEFSLLVITELASLLRYKIVKTGKSIGRTEILGDVLHVWAGNVVGVSSSSITTISSGDMLYAGDKRLELVTVVNLKVGKTDHDCIKLTPKFEFGAKLDKKIKVGSRLYRWIGP